MVLRQLGQNHYNDVIMSAMASQIASLTIVYSTIYSNHYIKAPRHWPLCGDFTGDRGIPRTKGQERGKYFHLMTSSCHVYRCLGDAMSSNSDIHYIAYMVTVFLEGGFQVPEWSMWRHDIKWNLFSFHFSSNKMRM